MAIRQTNNTAVEIRRVSSARDLTKAFAIRLRVFVKEQGVPAEIELDRDDQLAIHFLALKSGRAIGTARLVIGGGCAKIGRMAVLKSFRRKGVGTSLLKRAISTAGKLRAGKIYLHAQVAVIGFYEAMGFRCVGRIFDEASIPHRKMIFGGRASAAKPPSTRRNSPQRASERIRKIRKRKVTAKNAKVTSETQKT